MSDKIQENPILKMFNILIFLIVVLSKAIFDLFETLGYIMNDNIKYILIVGGGILYAIEYVLFTREKNKIFKKELISILCLITVFFCLTLYYLKKNNLAWDRRNTVELMYLLLPVLFSYFALKVISFNDYNKIVRLYFWMFCVIYVLEKGISVFLNFNLSMMNINESYSPLESNIVCIPATFLFAYFTYYKYGNYRYYMGSILLVILSFKRPLIVTTLFIILVDNIFELRFNLKKVWTYLVSMFFFVFTILYTFILSGVFGNFTSDQLNKFTSNRFWLLSLILRYSKIKQGYGSTTIFLGKLLNREGGRYLEMDLVKILIELGLIGLFVFCFVYFKICRNNALLILIMAAIFINLLTSHSLTDCCVWSCYLTFIGMVTYNSEQSTSYVEKRQNVKRLKFKVKL